MRFTFKTYEKWRKLGYVHNWPITLLDLVESEELCVDDANRLVHYCEETEGQGFPHTHEGWLYLLARLNYIPPGGPIADVAINNRQEREAVRQAVKNSLAKRRS